MTAVGDCLVRSCWHLCKDLTTTDDNLLLQEEQQEGFGTLLAVAASSFPQASALLAPLPG